MHACIRLKPLLLFLYSCVNGCVELLLTGVVQKFTLTPENCPKVKIYWENKSVIISKSCELLKRQSCRNLKALLKLYNLSHKISISAVSLSFPVSWLSSGSRGNKSYCWRIIGVNTESDRRVSEGGLLQWIMLYIISSVVCALLTWGRNGTRMHYGKKASWPWQCDGDLLTFW